MRRRDFVALLGGAGGWPVAARAQQPIPVIGFLHSASYGASAASISPSYFPVVASFREGLAQSGFQDRNVEMEFRWAHGRYDQLAALVAELIGRKVAVIVAGGGS